MEIYIRPGSRTEIPELISLQSLSLETFYSNDYEPVQIAALIKSQAQARELGIESILVAEVNREIVGFSALSNVMGQINAVYIHPDWVRRGIGKQLLASIEEIALQRRHHVLRVITSSTAASFYQSQGYKIKKPFSFRTRSRVNIPCYLLEKQLLPSHPIVEWVGRHPLIILLLLSLWFGVNFYYSHKQNRRFIEEYNIQPQLNIPSRDIKSM